MQEILVMSKKERDKYYILQQVLEKKLKQNKAAELLKLSDRQVRNLLSTFKKEGPKGLVSKKRGKLSNRAYDVTFKKQITALIREKYPDFGPTFAQEKLLEYHKLNVSVETLRLWMIEENLWVSRKSRRQMHPLRPRRDYFGELIQIDASIHHWFENRSGKCALIVFIDDATSKITSLFFCKVECLEGYFTALKNHLLKYGRPVGLYSDRHAIFGGSDHIHNAQFIRALKELGVESLLANSPQAKGRVERVNQTLQDRLVKEMRLRNISNIEDANHYLEEFVEVFNKKFSKEPRGQIDAHRPLDSGYDLERILARCEVRTLTKDLSFSYHSKIYKIMEPNMINRLKCKKIEVRQNHSEELRVFYENKELRFVPIEESIGEKIILDCKEKIFWAPEKGHPWKRYGYQLPLSNKLKQMRVMI